MINLQQQCMTFMKEFMYPDGPLDKYQHRDVIRCYMAGYMEGVVAVGDQTKNLGNLSKIIKVLATDALAQTAPIAQLNWFPDASWVWWTPTTKGPLPGPGNN